MSTQSWQSRVRANSRRNSSSPAFTSGGGIFPKNMWNPTYLLPSGWNDVWKAPGFSVIPRVNFFRTFMKSLGLGALDLPLFSYIILISFKFKNRCILERDNSTPFTAFVVFLWPSPTNLSPSVAGGASRHARFAGGTRHVNCLHSADGRSCCWIYHRMVLKIVRNSNETNKTLWCGVKINY